MCVSVTRLLEFSLEGLFWGLGRSFPGSGVSARSTYGKPCVGSPRLSHEGEEVIGRKEEYQHAVNMERSAEILALGALEEGRASSQDQK